MRVFSLTAATLILLAACDSPPRDPGVRGWPMPSVSCPARTDWSTPNEADPALLPHPADALLICPDVSDRHGTAPAPAPTPVRVPASAPRFRPLYKELGRADEVPPPDLVCAAVAQPPRWIWAEADGRTYLLRLPLGRCHWYRASLTQAIEAAERG